jgi:hypothetical protein
MKRPYCFAIPERSHVNAREADDPAGWCDTCDHFLDCQYAAITNHPKILTLNLKKKHFDDIVFGDKLEEYREAKDFWIKRLEGKHFDCIEICHGYPEKGDLTKRVWYRYHGFEIKPMYYRVGDLIFDGPTIVIPLREMIEYPYRAKEQ